MELLGKKVETKFGDATVIIEFASHLVLQLNQHLKIEAIGESSPSSTAKNLLVERVGFETDQDGRLVHVQGVGFGFQLG